MPIVDRADLFLREGSSDKEYHAQIMDEDGAFSVLFQYGRRGSSLTAGAKGTNLSEEQARKVFDKLVNEKRSKGYRVVETLGTSQTYQPVATDELQTDLRPQLLNAIDEARLEALLADDDWILQEKMDGKRIMIRKDASGTVAINKKGKIVSIPQEIIDEINRIPRDIIVDGELVGEKYYVFDVASFGGRGLLTDGYRKRLATLLKIGSKLNWGAKMARVETEGTVLVVCGSDTEENKRNDLESIRARRGEGVVLKFVDAPYTPGRPNSGGSALKYKFTEMATCLVASRETGKRSVFLEVFDGDGEVRPIGKVTIPANFDIPKADELVEIRYLYAYPNGSLYQTVYLGVRDDQDKPDDYSSLKFKAGSEEDDDGE